MSIDHGLGLPGAVRQRRRLRRCLISGNDGRDDSRVILGCLIPGEQLPSRIRRPEQGCNLPLNLNGGGRQPLDWAARAIPMLKATVSPAPVQRKCARR